jgi:hypothetical protein
VGTRPLLTCALVALALAGCSKLKFGKGNKAAPATLGIDTAAIRARRDSLREAAAADSAARFKWVACTDSVTAVLQKTKAGKKKLATQPPEGMIRPEFLEACGKPPAGAAPVVAATTPAAPAPAATPAPATPAPQQTPLTPKQLQVQRADSIRRAKEQAKADSAKASQEKAHADSVMKAQRDSVRTDSLARAKETEVLRETFSYGGGSRDPFASLITTARVGPEFSDLLLVGVYIDLKYAANSVAVVRDKNSGKRYKLRVGDQIGRLKVAQIRQLDVVFTVEDFGFERQETLSMKKREVETP